MRVDILLLIRQYICQMAVLRTLLTLMMITKLVFSIATSNQADNIKCGYQSCHPVKENMLNVHLVAHTHDDVGWLKTEDQYYYGIKNKIQVADVRHILSSVNDALKKNKNRRFIYVETSYFWRWWLEQTSEVKNQFKSYVQNGQLEFIGGGWTMNDEAVTSYQAIIDQFTWGLRKLNDTFGECGHPKTCWQIDPFGHSLEMASICTNLGFDSFFIGRLDQQEKYERFRSRTNEMMWQSGNNSKIFTSILFNMYNPPDGFCFDISCFDDPIVDDPKSSEYNADLKVLKFLLYCQQVASYYRTNNILITMGGDFQYLNADMWFDNIDKLIKIGNRFQGDDTKVNLIYSTPSCYAKAVTDEAARINLTWSVKTSDFFPNSADSGSYWTGFYTSRPTLKDFIQRGNNFLQVCKQLSVLSNLRNETEPLDQFREAVAVMQHHDAVTGTEREIVAYNYAEILHEGYVQCEGLSSKALRKLTQAKESNKTNKHNFETCLLTNISSCTFTESASDFIVTIYNPLSRTVSEYVRFPVTGTSYMIKDPNGTSIEYDLMPIAKSVIQIPGRISPAKSDLIFYANHIPPLGFKSYYVIKKEGNNVVQETSTTESGFENVYLDFDRTTGFLSKINVNGINLNISQEFMFYKGFVGDNQVISTRSSGAYIFRPLDNIFYNTATKIKNKIYRGKLVTEIQQVFNNWTSQVIRVYKHHSYVEFNWLVGPIPSNQEHGYEVISRFYTNLNSASTFYTDSNGRRMMKRIKNKRADYDVFLSEPVSGNYYPVTSSILIRDLIRDLEVSVLTDRPQGGSSLENGQIELMVHRNCLHDDNFGLGETLVEKAFGKGLVARGSHYLVVGRASENISSVEHKIAQKKLMAPWTFYSPTLGKDFEDYKKHHIMEFQGLTQSLPKNVQILTLEPWKNNNILLRLEHIFEETEHVLLSQPVAINLQDLFASYRIISVQETTLGGNQWLKKNKHLKFTSESKTDFMNERSDDLRKQNFKLTSFKIYLRPLEIRTFVVTLSN